MKNHCEKDTIKDQIAQYKTHIKWLNERLDKALIRKDTVVIPLLETSIDNAIDTVIDLYNALIIGELNEYLDIENEEYMS